MSTAQISTKHGSIASKYIRRTAGLLKGATGDYIKEAMPISTSTISSMKDTIKPFASSLSNISGSVITKTRQLNVQQGIRKINDWFLGMDNMFGGFDVDSDLSFDIDVDNASPAEIDMAQLSAEEKSSRQISKTVVETSHKMVEAQLSATANILTSMDKLGAAVVSGFDNVNATLNKILEVTTKNTSALIEASVAASAKSTDPREKMLTSGKFDWKSYQKMIGSNVSNSQYGMIMSILPMLSGGMAGTMFSADNVASMGLNALLNKMAPNLKKNMRVLDDSINNMIMSSLIRLGEQRDKAGLLGTLGKIFGVNGDRKNVSTDRAGIELKAIPYDTISKEALTNAIPGYLRQIVMQLGGPDMVYDYRSRSFKTKNVVSKEFRDQAVSTNTFNQASAKVRNSLSKRGSNDPNYDNFRDMVYDLLIEDMSGSTRNAGNTLNSFRNKSDAKKYIEGLIKDARIPRGNGRVVDQLAQAFSGLDDRGRNDIKQQIVSNNMQRSSRLRKYKSDADDYEVDLSHLTDSIEENKSEIIRRYTGKSKSSLSRAQGGPGTSLVGTDYTNAALFEIYRRLNKGINVFQVGSSNSQSKKFKGMGKLKPPSLYKTDNDVPDEERTTPLVSSLSGSEDHTNILTDDTQTDANGNPLTGKQKFGKWASMSGKNLVSALFRGNPEDVRKAFGQMVGDISGVAAKPIRSFLMGDPTTGKQGIFAKINDSFGNVSGYLKHKFMGTGYEYTNEKGQRVKVSDNEKGGVIGFLKDRVSGMFKGSTEKTKKWFGEVAKYFDFRSDNDKASGDTASKRKSLLAASVGAMAGLGFIGGPFGLIFGALAGSALQAGGIGTKIKEALFGKDYTDKKGNQKHKLGLVEKAVNGIVDPIRYQIGKTFSAFGNVMKKNILGPLADIGVAIRERMANAAGGVVSKTFGKVFGGLGWVIKKLFSIPLAIAKAPIALLGGATRGGMQAAGGTIGTGLGAIANLIAGKEGREVLKQRRADRKEEVDNDKEASGYYGGYKKWKSAQDEKRKNSPKFADYVSEQQEIIAESSSKTEENTAKISEDIGNLAYHATHHDPVTDSSIYTSDVGLHERIDSIFAFLKDHLSLNKSDHRSTPNLSSISGSSYHDDSNDDSNALLSSSIGISSANGLSRDDVEDVSSIADESNTNKPNKKSILARFKSLLKRNSQEDEEESSITGEKKNGEDSGLSKIGNGIKGIFSAIGDIIPGWAGPLGALLLSTMIPGINTFLWGDGKTQGAVPKLISALADAAPAIGKAIGKGIKGFLTGLFDSDGDGDVTEQEAAKGAADINSGIDSTITNPLLGDAQIAGANVTGNTNPAGLFGTVNNAKRIGSAVTNMAPTSFLSKIPILKNLAKPAQFITGLTKIPGAVAGAVKNTIDTAKAVGQFGLKTTAAFAKTAAADAAIAGTSKVATQAAKSGLLAGIKAGVQGVIKFLGAILGFILDGLLMLLQGNEVYGKDKYTGEAAQQIGLVVGGAIGGTGGGFADGFQWADLLDIGGNALKWMGLGAAAGSVVPILGNGIGAIVGFIIGLIFGMIGGKTIAKGIGDLLEKVGNLVNGKGKGHGRRATGHGMFDWVGDAANWVGNAATDAWNATTDAVGTAANAVGDAAAWVGEKIVDGVKYIGGVAAGVWDSIKKAGQAVAGFVGSLVGKGLEIFNLIKKFKPSGIDSFLDLIGSIGEVIGFGKGFGPIQVSQRNLYGISQNQPNIHDSSDSSGHGRRNIYYQGNYGSNLNMNKSGCGPIAASYLANAYGKNITPEQAAKMLNGTNYRDSDGGTSSAGVAAIGNSLGIPMRSGSIDTRDISQKLSNGEPVAFLGKSDDPNSPYTKSGHFVIGEGFDSSGNVIVMDPLSPNKKRYRAQNLLNGLEDATYTSSISAKGYGPGENNSMDLVHGFPYLRQGGDAPWSKLMYGTDTMAASACGPTSLAMVLSGASHKFVNPYDVAQFSLATGNRVPNVGTAWKLMPDAAKEFGLNVKESSPNQNFVDSSLSSGKPVILVGTGPRESTPFTNSGHFVVAVGKQGNNYLINDPAGRPAAYSWNQLSGARNAWAFDNKGQSILNQNYNSMNDSNVIDLSSLSNYSGMSGTPGSSNGTSSVGGVFSQVFNIIKTAGSKIMNFLGITTGATDLSGLSDGAYPDLGGYPADNAASSIIFSKIQNLDTSYTDYPGRNISDKGKLDFILRVAPGVQATMECGVLASLRIAQAILESGWGQSGLTKRANNLFGMKAFSSWTGKRVNMKTGEWSASQGNYSINADFRAYDSWNDSIADQANNYVKTSNYKAAGLLGEKDYRQACIKVRQAGYATDPNYPSKLIDLIDTYKLTYFDHPKSKSSSTWASNSSYNNYLMMKENQLAAMGNGPGDQPVAQSGYTSRNIAGGMGGDSDTDIAAINAIAKKRSSLSNRNNNNIKAQGGVRGRGPSKSGYSSNSGYSLRLPNGKGISSDGLYQYDQETYPIPTNSFVDSNEKLEHLLSAALVELRSINNNTGKSTDVLSGMAKVAVGSNLNIPPKSRSRGMMPTTNNTNVSSVMSIVKPV